MRVLAILLCCSALLQAQSSDGACAAIRRGQAMSASGQLEKAAAIYQSALQNFPADPELSFQLGMVHFQQAKWIDAIRDFNGSLRSRPKDIKTLFYLAEAYFFTQSGDLARQTIARAAEIAPDDAQICQKYGEYLSAGLETRGDGLVKLRRARHLNPRLPRIDFDIAKAQFDLTDFRGAISGFAAALKSDPQDGEAAFYRAESWGKLGDWGNARADSQYALAHGYTTGAAYYEFGLALNELGDANSALEPLRHALALQPSLIQAHFQLQRAYRNLDRLDDAHREAELFAAMANRTDTARESRTTEEQRAWNEVRPLLESHHETEALAYIAKLPEPPQYGPAYPLYLLGTMYFSIGQKEDAERVLLAAHRQAPASSHISAYLGMVQLSLGEEQAAENNFAAALALDSSETLAQIGLGVIDYHRGQWDEAIRYLEQSRTADPGTLYLLCDAYLKVGKTKEALLTAQVIHALGSDNQTLLAAVDQLVGKYEAAPASLP